MEEFLKQNQKLFPFAEIKERQAASIDLKMITTDEDFAEVWPKFEEDLTEKPEHTLACLGLALHQVSLVETRKQGAFLGCSHMINFFCFRTYGSRCREWQMELKKVPTMLYRTCPSFMHDPLAINQLYNYKILKQIALVRF